MSSRGFTPPDDEPDTGIFTNEGESVERNIVDGHEEGEPDTKDDEFAQDDAPEQTFDEDAV